MEAVTVRAVVSAPAPMVSATPLEEASAAPPLVARDVTYGGRCHQAASVRRVDLRAGHELDGPLIVVEYSGTTWVPPEWTLRVDAWGSLHLAPLPDGS